MRSSATNNVLNVEITNPSRENLIGSVEMRSPDGWMVENEDDQWETAPGETNRIRQHVVLSNTAKIGDYRIPIDFRLDTTPPKFITVQRDVKVGPDGLLIRTSTRRVGTDGIRVRIEMTNTSPKVQSYDCMLFPPPGRRYQVRFMTIPPGQTVRRDFLWPYASDLRGETMLMRAVEQDGNRVLNYDVELGL